MSLEINGEFIDDELIEEEFQYTCSDRGLSGSISKEQKEKILEEVKEDIISKTLMRQQVEKVELPLTDQQLAIEVKNFQNWNQRAAGMSSTQLKEYVYYKLRETKLVDGLVSDMDPPQRSHFEEFYRDNQDAYRMKGKYWLEVIVSDPSDLSNSSNPSDNEKIVELQGYEEELTIEGKKLIDQLRELTGEKTVGNNTIPYSRPITVFKPFQWSKNGESQQGINITVPPDQQVVYRLKQSEMNYLPPFEEVEQLIQSDLLEEMKQLKVAIFLRKLMKESKVVDNLYLD